MTRQEFEYIKRAVAALESGDCSDLTQHKILKTVSQITDRAAQEIEDRVWDRVHQNIVNPELMGVLKHGSS